MVLPYNEQVIRYPVKTGLNLDNKIERRVTPRTTDAMLDMCFSNQTAEGWRDWAVLGYCLSMPGTASSVGIDRPRRS